MANKNPLFRLYATWYCGELNFGINFPKGIFVHYGNFLVSKEGVHKIIYECYNTKNPLLFFLARFYGLLDTILFFMILPIMMIVYLTFILFFLMNSFWLSFTLPFKFKINIPCIKLNDGNTLTNRSLCKAIYLLLGSAILTFFVIIVYCIMTPLQILLPELTAFIFQLHKWVRVIKI